MPTGTACADSGLFRIPVGDLEGITYFGAVRIVDHNSAVNVSTAMSREYEFDGSTGANVDLVTTTTAGSFLSNIGLGEMLRSLNTAGGPPSVSTFSVASSNEFADLYQLRFGTANLPGGVIGNALNPNPIDDAVGSSRLDFQYNFVGEALSLDLGQRIGNPGYTIPGIRAYPAFGESLALVARFSIAFADDSSNALVAALPLSTRSAPSGATPAQPYSGTTASTGIDRWFRDNFDSLREHFFVPQTASDVASFTNRRSLLTAYNPVSNQASAPVVVPANVAAVLNLTPPLSTNATAKVSINTARFEDLFVGFFNTMAKTGFTGGGDDAGVPFATLYANAQIARAGTAVTTTPFSAASPYVYSSPTATPVASRYYDDPYIGTRFETPLPAAQAPLTNDRTEPGTTLSVVNGQTAVTEQHPLRMFRSPLRAPAVRNAAGSLPTATTPPWDDSIPRLPADQVVILRSAIAAANLEAMRDSSHNHLYVNAGVNDGWNNDRVVRHVLPVQAYINNVLTTIVANVYGMRRQPFITEVYANSSTQDDAIAPSTTGLLNPKGYVAIKLYNPYPVPISLQNCRLVGMHRMRDVAYTTAGTTTTPSTTTTVPTNNQYPTMTVSPLAALTAANIDTTDQIDLGTAVSNVTGGTFLGYIIPPKGTLVLENYPGAVAGALVAEDATHRPNSSGLIGTTASENTGAITAAAYGIDITTQNFAYVPGMSRVVWDRDLVLMRPTNCTPPTSATQTPASAPLTYTYADPSAAAPTTVDGMVPIDSYDFTGLAPYNDVAYPPARPRAEVWHYTRTSDQDSWKWVYPGRYDANQSIPKTAAELPAARQQGTYRAVGTDGLYGWNPTVDKDPIAQGISPLASASLLKTANTTPTIALYPDVFSIQLNTDPTPADSLLHDWTQINGLGAVQSNLFPFGGLRRLGDLLETPFIGSYTLQYAVGNDTYLEVTPVTLDSVFAEDTDPADNEKALPVTDNGTQSREQIGRFVPLRPSKGGGSGYTNGAPGIYAADSAAITNYAVDSDPAFDINNPPLLDELRYRDDAADDETQQLPSVVTVPPDLQKTHVRMNRYQWANALFDHFTFYAPHDDTIAGYPTQPNWQGGTFYSFGDTVQYGQHAFVCNNPAGHLSTAGDPAYASPAFKTAEFDPGDATVVPPVPPAGSANWLPLVRNAISNASASSSASLPGTHSNLKTTAGANSIAYQTTDDNSEVTTGIQGQININTAPERVLAMVPWIPAYGGTKDNLSFAVSNVGGVYSVNVTNGGDGYSDNEQIARLITQYRDGNYNVVGGNVSSTDHLNFISAPSGTVKTGGASFVMGRAEPFKSLYDLYRVPGLLAAQNQLLALGNPNASLGDYTPAAGVDNVRFDFEEQTLLLNRVSNLITTRSDTFTIYVLVQGWRNAGTQSPSLVVQRRATLVVDRSAMTRTNGGTVTGVARVPTQ